MSNFEDTWVNLNGHIVPAHDAKISIFDRGFLYGDSIYEVSYAKKGKVLFLNEHLERLENSARLLSIKLDLTRDEITHEIYRTLETNPHELTYIRIIFTRGQTDISLAPQDTIKNNWMIITKKLSPPPIEHYEDGVKLMTSTFLRNSIKSMDPNAKSGNYLNNIMAVQEAKQHGFYDAIMLNHKMEITEGTTFNIFLIKKNSLYTPSLSSGLLKGITRQKVIEICQFNNIKIFETTLSLEDLSTSEEVFITSSTRGVMPVSQIDKMKFPKSISNTSITSDIRKKYLDLINK